MRYIFVYIILLIAVPTYSQEETSDTLEAPEALREMLDDIIKTNEENNKEIGIEIDGLLIDETKTKAGRDFYDLFYTKWEAPAEAKNFTITITEKPFRLSSTLMMVEINDNLVFQSILQPRQEIIEQLTEQAISYAYNYLINYEEIMKQLEGEDQTGTGIY